MKQTYLDWINNYSGSIYRRCKEVSEEMKQAFPELTIAKGMVTIIENGKDYQHQWLTDESGKIVDPTARQWEKILAYKAINEGDLEPVGKCVNCGEWVYGKFISSLFCSKDCAEMYRTSLLIGMEKLC